MAKTRKSKPEKTVLLAPKKPNQFNCPECDVDNEKTPLKFKHSVTTQWGCCVTRYDYYRCKLCRQKFVSTNGQDPDLAA